MSRPLNYPRLQAQKSFFIFLEAIYVPLENVYLRTYSINGIAIGQTNIFWGGSKQNEKI